MAVAAQLVKTPHDNPPVTGELVATKPIAATLHRACYDCHSNETVWPWYGAIAPIAWIVSSHVQGGRDHLNFSEWDDYTSDPATEAAKYRAIAKMTRDHRMPPWYYRVTHPRSRLTAAARAELINWAEREEQRAAASAH